MARLIEIPDVAACPSPLRVQSGDVLVLRASGARIDAGFDSVVVLGPFTAAMLGDNGEVIAAMGAPGTVLLQAREPGDASITVIGGDPFHAPRTIMVRISVQP
ncbi:hypothetical protein [Variovorax sp. J31P207]|uniref:hypothetical protein n=1 Tax=Variovorax sp. J31P207 TaxID=3053510 RepID=UPI002574A2C9|nr:hypothetical protein [Variovorax sp. J31P207]MDM0065422.1 hypothetical protein [Variovorax sp. J31P207]